MSRSSGDGSGGRSNHLFAVELEALAAVDTGCEADADVATQGELPLPDCEADAVVATQGELPLPDCEADFAR